MYSQDPKPHALRYPNLAMPRTSPTTEGFRVLFRRPSFALAEISWRWAFGGTACLLLTLLVGEYLRTLPVSGRDLLLLRSRQPAFISQALAHIFAGSGLRLIESSALLALALAALWMVVSSLGRAATVRSLLDYFRERIPANDIRELPIATASASGDGWRLGPLFGLGFLRVAITLATVIGIFAAAIVGGLVSSKTHPHPALAFLLFVAIAMLVGFLWSFLNWFFSLAPIFAINYGRDTFGSISATIDFCRQRAGSVFWSSTAFGLLHLVIFVVATSAVFMPMMFAGLVPRGIVLAMIALLTIAYFAIIDFLYLGRLASYVCILHTPEELPAPRFVPPLATVTPHLPVAVSPLAINETPAFLPSDDDILSDVPGLVPPDQKMQTLPPIPPSDDDIVSDIRGLVPPPESSTEN